MVKKQKLELTWVGKGEEPVLEPRILIEDPTKSYGDPASKNMLIHGDNLLTLRALEQDYTNKIKCIYIDPPYNTGSAFEFYDDGIEHSIWLTLMYNRLIILHKLLRDDGAIYVQIDDNEMAYLKLILDEIFGRENFIATVALKMSTASGVKTSHRDKKIIKEKEYILCYSKSKPNFRIKPQYVPSLDWDNEFQYFLNRNNSKNIHNWTIERLSDVLKKAKIPYDQNDELFKRFVIDNANSIWRRAFIRNEYKQLSQDNPEKIFADNELKNFYYRGRQMYFYSNKFHSCFTENGTVDEPSHLLGDFWSDINTGKLFNEGGVDFRNGKKPEFLIARILKMSSDENDIILDSFLGSGTTAAVAHKMNRQWIGVELGDHIHTHCIPRMQSVVDGSDKCGASKASAWQGGGGFKFYELATSLLNKDKFNNWVISKDYDSNMLAHAMAKQEGFKYSPCQTTYWKQGYSTENDFIYTTTNYVSVELIDAIRENMQKNESLIIACKAFDTACKNRYDNITIKKIPQILLGRCEFGKDDYSLNIVEPVDDDETNEDIEG